ncbi:MAG: thiol peroxidase [Spirochaetaceae bacterium]|nr:thiol peroxidase [Spirochaetaceae bacterium]MCF7950991.1 thiol peroxidase [Spirochaetaceae bacterium]
MAQVTFKGNPIHTSGDLPQKGSEGSDFSLTSQDLQEHSLQDYAGKRKILNIVPSLDTGVCAASAKTFEARADQLENTVVITVSMDLPFAQKRFCSAEGIENVVTLSAFRSPDFAQNYGVAMVDGPMRGLLARAVVVLDEKNRVTYTELVPEIAQEPDYDAAVAALG